MGDGGRWPTLPPSQAGCTRPRTPHLVDEAVVHQLGGQVLGTVGCGGVGRGVRPAVLPARLRPCRGSPTATTPPPRPTWEQVVGELLR